MTLRAGGPLDPIGELARSGAIAGVIKLASAGLAFIMFVAIALITDERQFGLFGAAYAGASLVSFFNPVGQQSAVLRFWPEYASIGNLPVAQAMMARSLLLAAGGIALSAIAVAAVGFLPWFAGPTPEWLPLCLATALLAVALGWSEVASGAMRAKSVLIAGLLPRDVTWRALTISAVFGLWLMGVEMSATEAILLCAVLLLVAVVPQSCRLIVDTMHGPRQPL
jgi:O-antigen/teichoic acid export membrane protein